MILQEKSKDKKNSDMNWNFGCTVMLTRSDSSKTVISFADGNDAVWIQQQR